MADTALKTRQIIDKAQAVLAIELIAGARPPISASRTISRAGDHAAYEVIRSTFAHLEADRPLYPATSTR